MSGHQAFPEPGLEVVPNQDIPGIQHHNDKFSVVEEASPHPVHVLAAGKHESYVSSAYQPSTGGGDPYSPYQGSSTIYSGTTPGPNHAGLYSPPPGGGHPDQSGTFGEQRQTGEKKRICGLRRTTFALLVIIAILVIGGAAGGAAAAVLSKKNNTTESSGSGGASGASTTSSLPGTLPTGTPTTSTPPASSTPGGTGATPTTSAAITTSTGVGGVLIECPSAHNVPYTVPASSASGGKAYTFLRQCGVNYPFSDTGRSPAQTMQDCLGLCAQFAGEADPTKRCSAVVWNYGGVQGTDLYWCWMKNGTGGGTTEYNYPNIESAVLIS